MSGYTHLTQNERYQISAFLGSGKSLSSIAKQLGRNKSTLCRELRRNSGLRGYRPQQAQEKATHRLKYSLLLSLSFLPCTQFKKVINIAIFVQNVKLFSEV